MVDTLGLGVGITLTLIMIVFHFSKGTGWQPREDISDEVLEHRAATVPETAFPEPMNRSIGGGAAGVGAAVTGETEAEGELEEGEEAVGGDDPSAIPDDEAEVYEVEFVKQGKTIDVKENTTLLEAGEGEGWDLPYACREGQCISCGGHITNGHAEEYVEHHTNQMLGEAELSDGYTLTCVAYPTADLSLETGESP
ncbi:2Fe-2S iron-sulfur cluster-binding protein [Halocatena salina]|uniref:2Fe-2S iron-sulfur cluster-binding protein n=1 Tax=Halocatena salina TaxID=2934340 RepID=A0A8U0A699_9EURY|nr:2Fe-2S iron-sulfur cluster-binding protein [Halocatena salina]UPM44038.1 2Fe-2S iron-sulfur cluster-binding protein [Halocatena salina]